MDVRIFTGIVGWSSYHGWHTYSSRSLRERVVSQAEGPSGVEG
jgi:hypothetical protein